jgi:glycosidase
MKNWVIFSLIVLGLTGGRDVSHAQLDNNQTQDLNPKEVESSTNPIQEDKDKVLEKEVYTFPESKDRQKIRYRKTKGSRVIELWHIGNKWKKGFPTIPSTLGKDIVEVDIKELNLPEGRLEFKFVIDGEFEPGYNRVLWVKDGLLHSPTNTTSKMERGAEGTNTLRFEDDSASILELRTAHEEWKKTHPLIFKNGAWEINTRSLNLPTGKHEYKLVKDGKLEAGANRNLFIDNKGRVFVPAKGVAQIKLSETPSPILEVFAPYTTYLAIRTAADQWAKEYPLTNDKDRWFLNINELGLKEGTYAFKFVDSEGFESGGDRTLHINESGEIYWPTPWIPTIENLNSPSASLHVNAPLQRYLALRHSGDKWEKEYPLKKENSDWVIEASELSLSPGEHQFKFVTEFGFEPGKNKKIQALNNGTIVVTGDEAEPQSIETVVLETNKYKFPYSEDGETIAFKRPEGVEKIDLVHQGDNWGKRHQMIPSPEKKEIFTIKVSEAMIPDGRTEFKFILDGKQEEGPNRVVFVKDKKLSPPEKGNSMVLKDSEETRVLRVRDDSATTLAIVHSDDNWASTYPLQYKDGLWRGKIEDMGFRKGSARFKFVKDGELEGGANRLIHIDKDGKHYRKYPKTPKLLKSHEPTKKLVVEAPNTTYLAIKLSNDGWLNEYQFERAEKRWEMPIEKLNLQSGEYDFRFVDRDGLVEGENNTLYINEKGEAFFPYPWAPELEKTPAPSKSLIFKAPHDGSIRIVHEGTSWSKVYDTINLENFKPNPNNTKKVKNQLENPPEQDKAAPTLRDKFIQIDVETLELKEGRTKYKFLINGELEEGLDRVFWVNEKGEFYLPEEKRSELIGGNTPVENLRFKDLTAISLEIKTSGDNWEKTHPLKESKGVWSIPIKSLGLEKGIYEYKLIKNGNLEAGANRVLNVISNNRHELLEPKKSVISLSTSPSPILRVQNPNTRYLAIKTSGDGWEKEFPMSAKKNSWELSGKSLNLKEGRYNFKLIDGEGYEEGPNKVFWMNKGGEFYLREPLLPQIIPIETPSQSLKIIAPNQSDLRLRTSADGWKNEIKLTETKEGMWEINNKDIKLPEGLHEMKLIFGNGFELGANRLVGINQEGLFVPLEVEKEGNPEPEKGMLRVRVPSALKIGVRHSLAWDKEFELKKDPNNQGDWIISLEELGLKENHRFFFKFIINNSWEKGPNRVAYISKDKSLMMEEIKTNNNVVMEDSQKTSIDSYFGPTLPISPNAETSLKGSSDWFEEARMYHIWVPSFKDSTEGRLSNDGYGDIKGIIETVKSGYFENLKINTIWLSPIFRSGEEDYPSETMHGYDTSNFYEINKNFGSEDDLKELLKTTHEKGIRVILEYIPNHVSKKHPWFMASRDPKHPQHDKYKDWFIWSKEKKPKFSTSWLNHDGWHKDEIRGEYYYGLFGEQMPDLNYRNKDVINEMINISIYWLNEGADGFRIDANKYLFENFSDQNNGGKDQKETIEFYKEYRRIIDEYEKLGYPKVMVAENWSKDLNEIEIYGTKDSKPSFPLTLDFTFPEFLSLSLSSEKMEPIYYHLTEGKPKTLDYVRFLSNHDNHEPRAKTAFGDDTKLAGAINMLLPGPYIIYYGEEVGMEATKGLPENMRKKMVWDETKINQDLLSWYQKISNIRMKFSDIIKYEYMKLLSEKDEPILIASFEKEGTQVVIIINPSLEDKSWKIETKNTREAKSELTEKTFSTNEGYLEGVVPSKNMDILVLKK